MGRREGGERWKGEKKGEGVKRREGRGTEDEVNLQVRCYVKTFYQTSTYC